MACEPGREAVQPTVSGGPADPITNEHLYADRGARQSALYWRQMEQLKAAAVCSRLARNRYAGRVRTVEFVKAGASSGAIAAWFATDRLPHWLLWLPPDTLKFAWGAVIAAAQLLDVFKHVFPFTKLHEQTAELTVALETLFIDTEDEWQKIYIGKIGESLIIDRLTKLKKAQLAIEKRYFPSGFAPSADLIEKATEETRTYFQLTYQTE